MVDFRKLRDRANDLVEKRGGTEGLKQNAAELREIAKSKGSMVDKAKAAAAVLKETGGEDPAQPAAAAGAPAAKTPRPDPAAPTAVRERPSPVRSPTTRRESATRTAGSRHAPTPGSSPRGDKRGRSSLGVLQRIGTLLADLGFWFRTHRLLGGLTLALVLVVAAGVLYLAAGRSPSFDAEVFGDFRVGDSVEGLEDDLGDPDYTDRGKAGRALAWVEDGIEYFVITRGERIVSKGLLACDDKSASAC